MRCGSIVTFRDLRWTVAGFEPGRVRLVRQNSNGTLSEMLAGEGSVILLEELPQFAVGSMVKMWGEKRGVVVADDGSDTIRVAVSYTSELGGPHSPRIIHHGEVDHSRHMLVVFNRI